MNAAHGPPEALLEQATGLLAGATWRIVDDVAEIRARAVQDLARAGICAIPSARRPHDAGGQTLRA